MEEQNILDSKYLYDKDEVVYFEEEMQYLIKAGEEFSKKYPSVAHNLKLTNEGSSDPHVQQIIESFAFLVGSLQKQVDESSYKISRSVVDLLYPNLGQPIPSMTIVEFVVNDSNPALLNGVTVPRDTDVIYDSPLPLSYKFKTIYDTFLFPANIISFKLDKAINYNFISDKNKKLLTINLELFSEVLDPSVDNKIRFYLDGSKSTINKVYDFIFNECQSVYIYSNENKYYEINKDNIKKVGFTSDEILLFKNKTTYDICRLIQEYFLLPEKFLFFDVVNLDLTKIDKNFSIIFASSPSSGFSVSVSKENLKLRCCPVINIFAITSEPVTTLPERGEYKMYTDHLKSKFLFFNFIDKLKYVDEESKEIEIKHVKDYSFFREDKFDEDPNKLYFEAKEDKKEPHTFKVNLYNNEEKIFLKELVMYADVFVTNAYFCEKLSKGTHFYFGEEFPIKHAMILKTPTDYISTNISNKYYWEVVSRLYSERVSFFDEKDLLKDIKAIISINIKAIPKNDKLKKFVEAIENIKIVPKNYNFKDGRRFTIIKGKEVTLFINLNAIITESVVILSEILFCVFKNTTFINNCITLIVVDKSSEQVLYTCQPSLGAKKNF